MARPNAGKSVTGAKRWKSTTGAKGGQIRVKQVTSDVGFTPDWLKKKTNAIHNVCSDWVGVSTKPMLSNSAVVLKPSRSHS